MTDPHIRLLFVIHAASSLYMAGLIWFVQVVHYPLFAGVGRPEFPAYEQRHTKLVTWVVAPPMLIEGMTALLLFWFRPAGVSNWALGTGLALLGVIWLSTALVQVPCHEFLSRDFNPDVHQRLVLTNWLRTIAWSLRGILMLWMLWSSLNVDATSSKHFVSTSMASLEISDTAPGISATTNDVERIQLLTFEGKPVWCLFLPEG